MSQTRNISKFSQRLFFWVLSLCQLIQYSNTEEIFIEGFVEPIAEFRSIEVDFSQIQITPYNMEEIAKDSAYTAQPNGYFIIPNWDMQSVKLKIEGPQGSVFEPPFQMVFMDPGNASEYVGSQHTVNFTFQGFSIKGQVRSAFSNSGPSDIPVKLFKSGDVGNLLGNSVTMGGGWYTFEHMYPGEYDIIIYPLGGHKPVRITCHLNWSLEETCSKQALSVSGYQLTGQFVDVFQGLWMLLYSQGEGQAEWIIGREGPKEKLPPDTPIIQGFHISEAVLPNSQGVFIFAQVPNGEYKILPFFPHSKRSYKISPSIYTTSIGHELVSLGEIFEVIGFSIGGRVVSTTGKGIGDVEIQIDGGMHKQQTDADGNYLLEDISKGTYTIEALHAHYFFESSNAYIHAGMETLPPLVPSKYHLCGEIYITPQDHNKFSVDKRSVILTDKQKMFEQRQNTDEEGKFCFEVGNGEFIVKPGVGTVEAEAGLLLDPNYRELTVRDQPILGVQFMQKKVSLSGKLSCFNDDCLSKSIIKLRSLQHNITSTSHLQVGNIFKFEQILPGKYEISVVDIEKCWEKSKLYVKVGGEDYTSVSFTQTGYSLQYEVSHRTKVQIKHKTDATYKSQEVYLIPEQKEVCMEKMGEYSISPESCYEFGKSTYVFNTMRPEKLKLSPISFGIEGKIEVEHPESLGELSNVANMGITHNGSRDSDNQIVEVLPLSMGEGAKISGMSGVSKTTGIPRIYKFRTSLPGYTCFNLVPTPSEELTSENTSYSILFTPHNIQYCLQSECIIGDNSPFFFKANKGLILEGQVVNTPEVTIQIWLHYVLVATTYTGADGRYRVGPLSDQEGYQVNALKNGYKITRLSHEDKYNFLAEELSSLRVEILQDGKGPNELEGVYLSLSTADKSYRNSTYTDKQGQGNFIELNAGRYYLKALLKEYKFDPAQSSIQIEMGKSIKHQFTAKRIAFSAFGRVRLLNKDPVDKIKIKAECVSCEKKFMEESITDVDGQFRIRGLVPTEKYNIFILSDTKDNRLSMFTPKQIPVSVTNEDIKGLNFLAFLSPKLISISGFIELENEESPTIPKPLQVKVEIYETNNLEKAVLTTIVGPSRLFRFKNLPTGQQYMLRAIPTHKDLLHKYGALNMELDLTHSQYRNQLKNGEVYITALLPSLLAKKGKHASRIDLLMPLLLVGVVFMLMYKEKTKKVFEKIKKVIVSDKKVIKVKKEKKERSRDISPRSPGRASGKKKF